MDRIAADGPLRAQWQPPGDVPQPGNPPEVPDLPEPTPPPRPPEVPELPPESPAPGEPPGVPQPEPS